MILREKTDCFVVYYSSFGLTNLFSLIMKAHMIAKIFELTSAINSVLYTNMWYYGSATVSYEKASITEEVL